MKAPLGPGEPLPRSFYAREAEVVARALLGCVVVRRLGGRSMCARIVETEAYVGQHDAASHSRAGVTPRTAVMFGPPGWTYVYLVYGMHYMLNVVTGPEGSGQAVLLRGAEPLAGLDERLDGPGRLARALGVDLRLNRSDLCAPRGHVRRWRSCPGRRLPRSRRHRAWAWTMPVRGAMPT
jgi:DNA-3-methyladenine glycosylase